MEENGRQVEGGVKESGGPEKASSYDGEQSLFTQTQDSDIEEILDDETGEMVPKHKKIGDVNKPVDDTDGDEDLAEMGFTDMQASSSPAVREIIKSLLDTMNFKEDFSVSPLKNNNLNLQTISGWSRI